MLCHQANTQGQCTCPGGDVSVHRADFFLRCPARQRPNLPAVIFRLYGEGENLTIMPPEVGPEQPFTFTLWY